MSQSKCPSILSIYTDSESGYVALKSKGTIYEKQCFWTPEYTQASGFVPLLKELSDEVHFNFLNLDVVIAPKGPTSFTTLRITLTLAKSFIFCIPQARIFSPSQFHVLAFSARNQIEDGQEFLVLIDAFKHGFYGAVFCKDPKEPPFMTSDPAFYDQETGVNFLKKYRDCYIVTDFLKTSFACNFLSGVKNQIILPKINFAKMQIELFQSKLNKKDTFDYSTFSPFYLHTPMYEKIGLMNKKESL